MVTEYLVTLETADALSPERTEVIRQEIQSALEWEAPRLDFWSVAVTLAREYRDHIVSRK